MQVLDLEGSTHLEALLSGKLHLFTVIIILDNSNTILGQTTDI